MYILKELIDCSDYSMILPPDGWQLIWKSIMTDREYTNAANCLIDDGRIELVSGDWYRITTKGCEYYAANRHIGIGVRRIEIHE